MNFFKFIKAFAFAYSFFILPLSAMAYTCPHAEGKDTWHDAGAPAISEEIPCICHYMNALMEKFKTTNDLTMVLGAGDQGTDYTGRFQSYTFLVNDNTSPVLHRLQTDPTGNLIQQDSPFLVPLNFNNTYFFDFLSKLSGNFKKIIFDLSVTKFVQWGFRDAQKFCESLQADGEFYTDVSVAGGMFRELIFNPHTKPSELLPFNINLEGKTVTFQHGNQPFPLKTLRFKKLFLTAYRLEKIPPDFSIQDPIERVKSFFPEPALIAPNSKYRREHVKTFLEATGFAQAEIKKHGPESPYPLHDGFVHKPFDYVCAKKQVSLEGSSESSKFETLKTSLTHLKESLTRLSEKLGNLKTAPLADRIYRRQGAPGIPTHEVNHKIPIRFEPNDMLNTYVAEYNSHNPTNIISIENCHVIGGPFTYYDAIPLECNILKHDNDWVGPNEIHHDNGWGCAWRASLNLLNKIKEWLAQKKDINTLPQYQNRQVNMYDLQKLSLELNTDPEKDPHEFSPTLVHGNWMEPHHNAEMFLRFIEQWYSPRDQITIKNLLGLRGRLYRCSNKEDFIGRAIRKHLNTLTLIKLKGYIRRDGEESEPNDQETLDRFYTVNLDISPSSFPQFDEERNPFPLNVDDGTLARNIYGSHIKDNQVAHVFIGETHVEFSGRPESPWVTGCSGWYTRDSIFRNNDMMVFEIFLKDYAHLQARIAPAH